MSIYNLISFGGIFLLLIIAWAVSSDRRTLNWRAVFWGTLLQLLIGFFVFVVPAGAKFFVGISHVVTRLLDAAGEGARFCFGPLAVSPGQPGSLGFILLFQGLPTVVFFTALMQILYYIGLMPLVIRWFARVFTKLMRVSGAESLCAASNIFVGIESVATILPYLGRMTRSELCTVLTAGMATIASSVLGIYVFMLREHFPDIAGHLMSASVLSAPAAIVMSKLLLPEREIPETLGVNVKPHYEREANIIEAAINGAGAGGRLLLGIVTLLLAFLGLLALVNIALEGIGRWVLPDPGLAVNLRLEHLLAYVFYPLTLIIGVPPADAFEVARLLGQRAIMTEVPAYQNLDGLIMSGALHHGRSAVLAAYALCGFTHVASVAIFIGGISALAPSRTRTLAQVAVRAFIAATLACLMTAAVAGTFYTEGAMILTGK